MSVADFHFPSIPGYRIESLIGSGGNGAVYRATHIKLRRQVAIKCLPESVIDDTRRRNRFFREIAISGKLLHPNIVRAFDAGEIGGRPFIVMELIRGFDLRDCVRISGLLSIADVCEVVVRIAAALEHLSEHGVVHRDIKPANLMLTTAGQVKLLDVGLARSIRYEDDERYELTLTGDLVGTTDFMSPEQIKGTRELGIQVDIYGLGATAYFLLAGHAPYPSDRFDKPSDKLNAIVQGNAIPLSNVRKDLPSGLGSIIQRMMAPDPNERYNDPAELAGQIKVYCRSSNLRLLCKTVAKSATGNGGVISADRDSGQRSFGRWLFGNLDEDDRTWSSSAIRRRRNLIALSVVTAVLIGLIMVVRWRSGDDQTVILRSLMQPNDIKSNEVSPTEILSSPEWQWSDPEPIEFSGFDKLVSPTLTSDELTLVFNSYQHLYISTRKLISEPFGTPSQLDLKLNPNKCESPAISGDGLNLVCSFWIGEQQNDDANLYLFRRETIDQEFQNPELIRSVALPERQNGAWLSADGCTLMFTSFHESQWGTQMVTTRQSSKVAFERPRTVPFVESPKREVEPCLTSDGKTCLTTYVLNPLASRRQLVRRSWDSERSVFTTPVLLEINRFHGGSTHAAHLSQDGRRIYYSASDALDHFNYRLFFSRRARKDLTSIGRENQ
ncbi:MAG: serine/threonine protein kinase [Planctomycetales bacterium]|nr:serine/threonine protein kinase [Planctomycetales bacterium]